MAFMNCELVLGDTAMARKKQVITDAVEILHQRYFEGKPERIALLEEERANADIARMIYDLRAEAGLSQRQLAKQINTTASVICRLEDANYQGHSLAMLRRIAAALHKCVEIRVVDAVSQKRRAL
jgi:ribosome-binding protein aMBF1 (putative translation factor)